MYVSTGQEPRAFQVAHPEQLAGEHRRFIIERLESGPPLLTVY